MLVAQSLPMAVPIFNQRNEDDYEEVSVHLTVNRISIDSVEIVK